MAGKTRAQAANILRLSFLISDQKIRGGGLARPFEIIGYGQAVNFIEEFSLRNSHPAPTLMVSMRVDREKVTVSEPETPKILWDVRRVM
ncbi:unnamed protein product [Clonostachys rosea f. rosea IK726]|uniref:Uncharacterized protein n=1 Tax=Clonostachys rosea f. rosea IK726 TaxID=1349383 RepID=A0ACA9UW96_BIOOC|nr:unnamed protein product [Clonostachys rosea f. rosea IK726]